jgi:hypothetical protein
MGLWGEQIRTMMEAAGHINYRIVVGLPQPGQVGTPWLHVPTCACKWGEAEGLSDDIPV